VLSGFDGGVIRSVHGREAEADFGWCVAAAGDVDRDGVPDVAVSAWWADQVHVISGRDGRSLARLEGEPDSAFGVWVSAGADFDADGVPELLIGRGGAFEVWSVARERRLFDSAELPPPADAEPRRRGLRMVRPASLTRAVCVPDADGDGVPELVALGPARLAFVSGARGELLCDRVWTGPDGWLAALPRIADMDADRCWDLVVSGSDGFCEVWPSAGATRAISSAVFDLGYSTAQELTIGSSAAASSSWPRTSRCWSRRQYGGGDIAR